MKTSKTTRSIKSTLGDILGLAGPLAIIGMVITMSILN